MKDHLFAVLEDLDGRGLTNHVLVITRFVVTPADCDRLARLAKLKVTLLFTYSGIEDKRIEPFPSKVAVRSMATASGWSPRRVPDDLLLASAGPWPE